MKDPGTLKQNDIRHISRDCLQTESKPIATRFGRMAANPELIVHSMSNTSLGPG
jgi:hypothetical protein